MREVVIVEGVRTAIGRRKGMFAGYRPDELAAVVLEEVVKRADITKDKVDDVIMGCVSQTGEQAGNIARTSALIAGFPVEVPGVTIDRQCGSSQQAVHFAAQAIGVGDMDIVIAGGVENMTRIPMFSNMQGVSSSKKLTEKYEIINQGLSAERIAKKWNLSREELDNYSAESHRKALNAIKQEKFSDEIVPVKVKNENNEEIVVDVDEGPRVDTNTEVLRSLKTVFDKNGVITAGNASQMSDGASAILLMSKEKALELGLKPKVKVHTRIAVGSDPTLMLTGPISATKKALESAKLTIDDIDVYEVNEAFAPVPLAWLKEIGADPKKLNKNGGAIALGHPLGATGSKLLISLINELDRVDGKYGLLTICEGMGTANATIIERIKE